MLPKIIRLLTSRRSLRLSHGLQPLVVFHALVVVAMVLYPVRGSATEKGSGDYRLLTRSEGQTIVDAISDREQSTNSRRSRPDCSHLVNAIYDLAGFPYPYAKSSDIYRGHSNFVRVSVPQPGDLIVWRGHVGLVIDPRNHFFYSSLRSGLETEDYTSPYWRRHGVPRFYRYRTNGDESYITARRIAPRNEAEGNIRTLAVSQSTRDEDREEAPSSESFGAPHDGNNPSKHQSLNSVEISPNVRPAILTIATHDKPTIDQVNDAISEEHRSIPSGLTAESLLHSRSTVVIFNQFRVERVEFKGKNGWAFVSIDSEAALTSGTLDKAVRHDEQRWEMHRVKSGWTVVVPSENIYLPRAAAVRIFAQQLAQLANLSNSDTAVSSSSQESHLASLLNTLLNN